MDTKTIWGLFAPKKSLEELILEHQSLRNINPFGFDFVAAIIAIVVRETRGDPHQGLEGRAFRLLAALRAALGSRSRFEALLRRMPTSGTDLQDALKSPSFSFASGDFRQLLEALEGEQLGLVTRVLAALADKADAIWGDAPEGKAAKVVIHRAFSAGGWLLSALTIIGVLILGATGIAGLVLLLGISGMLPPMGIGAWVMNLCAGFLIVVSWVVGFVVGGTRDGKSTPVLGRWADLPFLLGVAAATAAGAWNARAVLQGDIAAPGGLVIVAIYLLLGVERWRKLHHRDISPEWRKRSIEGVDKTLSGSWRVAIVIAILLAVFGQDVLKGLLNASRGAATREMQNATEALDRVGRDDDTPTGDGNGARSAPRPTYTVGEPEQPPPLAATARRVVMNVCRDIHVELGSDGWMPVRPRWSELEAEKIYAFVLTTREGGQECAVLPPFNMTGNNEQRRVALVKNGQTLNGPMPVGAIIFANPPAANVAEINLSTALAHCDLQENRERGAGLAENLLLNRKCHTPRR